MAPPKKPKKPKTPKRPPRQRPLNEREKAFCRHYVATGEGAEAARRAGYSQVSCRVQAHRLLKRKEVQDEIARLNGKVDQAVNRMITTAATRAGQTGEQPQILPPDTHAGGRDPTIDEVEAEVAATLSRAWVVSRLMDVAETARGVKPVERVIAIKATRRRKNELGQSETFEEVTTTRVEVTERDLNAANRALELLGKEMDRREGVGGDKGGSIDDQVAAAQRERVEQLLAPHLAAAERVHAAHRKPK